MKRDFKSTYIFIDGGHLREYYKLTVSEWFENKEEIDFNTFFSGIISLQKTQINPNKLFYYDCLDNIPKHGETEGNLKERISNQELFFENIKSIVGSHVKLGRITGKTEKKKRQKEVDILLTVEMMNHAFRRNIDHAILLSGDGDFKPVVESLVDMGIFVTVMGDKQHTAKELQQAGDAYIPLNFDIYYKMSTHELRSKYKLPDTLMPHKGAVGRILEIGDYHGKECILVKNGAHGGGIWLPDLDSNTDSGILYYMDKMSRLKIYCKLKFGEEIKGIAFQADTVVKQ